MASGVKLVFVFTNSNGKKVQYSYNYAKSSATTAQVTTFAQALITNTSILEHTLVSVDSIKQITTSESEYDISNFALRTTAPRELLIGNPDIPDTDENEVTVIKEVNPPA